MPKILVVDDEKSIRTTLQAFLVDAGHDVICAADYTAGVMALTEQAFDLVISDILMPDGNGVDILRHARRTASNCLVILITGEPTIETASEAVRARAFDYLSKPVTHRTLLDAVDAALDAKRRQDEHDNLLRQNAQHQHALEALVAERTRQLKASESDMRALAGRLQHIREDESRRSAGRIHDEVGQMLTGLELDLSAIVRTLPGDDPVAPRLRGLLDALDATVSTVQSIAMDLHPPLLERLGRRAATKFIPVIMLTGNDDADVRGQAMYAYAERYLTKPVEKEILVEAVNRALQARPRQDARAEGRNA